MIHAKYSECQQVRYRSGGAIGIIKLVTVTHGFVIYMVIFGDNSERHLTESSLIPVEVETRFTGKG